MRAHLVELLPKSIKPALLRRQAPGWRDRCFLLQRAVHSLMYAVLLRFPRFDQFRVNPQLDTCTCAASAGVNHTESLESRARALDAKGAPLSVLIRSGSP